jgi:D-glycero-alpha-D-manno-heptose 1-phosphate guanylyltransferase
MEVIVLAGGLGTRLRSVVSEVPKCMAPIDGKPFLQCLLNYLNRFDISRVILSVGYLREVVFAWVKTHKTDYSFEIDFAVEKEPLGTGGGIALAMSYAKDSNILIVNGDTFFNVDLDLFYSEHLKGRSNISIALKPMKDFDRYGNVILKDNGIISEFKEKEHCSEGFINGGIYAVDCNAHIFDGLPDKFSFETAVLKPKAENEDVRGFIHDDYFIDIGIPTDYEKAQTELPELEKIMSVARNEYPGLMTLFLDRDGVINRLRPHDYVKTWSEFEFMPGILEALAIFAKEFKHIILVTNQRGVGKGLMSKEDLDAIHERMCSIIKMHGGRIDKIYECSALVDTDHNRKPNIGMFEQACKDFPDITPETSLMIGDADSDMQFASNCGMKGIRI